MPEIIGGQPLKKTFMGITSGRSGYIIAADQSTPEHRPYTSAIKVADEVRQPYIIDRDQERQDRHQIR